MYQSGPANTNFQNFNDLAKKTHNYISQPL